MLTVREVSTKINTPLSTVRLWAQQGRFPGAEMQESPIGAYWLIPETALDNFERPKPGRPVTKKVKPRGKG